MKIDPHSIVLSGKNLSRNDRLQGLRPGDEIKVSVLERINRHTALVDLKGTPVRLSFSEAVPQSREILLRYTSSAGGVMRFEMKRSPSSDFVSAFKSIFPSIPLPEKIPASMLREIKFGDPGIFGLMKALSGSSSDRSKNFEKITKKLTAAGFTRELPLVTAVLSGLSGKETALLSLLAGRDDPFLLRDAASDQKKEGLFFAEILSDFDRSVHPDHAFISFFENDGYHIAECVKGDDFFACSFDLPSAGNIECVIRGSEKHCSVILSCDGPIFDSFLGEASSLIQSLSSHYDKVELEILRRTDLKEKILALAGMINNNALDVTV